MFSMTFYYKILNKCQSCGHIFSENVPVILKQLHAAYIKVLIDATSKQTSGILLILKKCQQTPPKKQYQPQKFILVPPDLETSLKGWSALTTHFNAVKSSFLQCGPGGGCNQVIDKFLTFKEIRKIKINSQNTLIIKENETNVQEKL